METNKINRMIIAVAAGRSGGHILPALELAKIAPEQADQEIHFFAAASDLEKKILSKAPVIAHYLPIPSVQTRTGWRAPYYYAALIYAYFVALLLFLRNRPSHLITTGSDVAIPVAYAARTLAIPVDLYELNAIPGKTILLFTPSARSVYYCFWHTQQYLPTNNSFHIPYPLRYQQSDIILPEEARTRLVLSGTKKTVLILGGSQGSHFINRTAQLLVQDTALKNSLQIIHQTGSSDPIDWKKWYEENNIPALTLPFSAQMNLLYSAADVIICRAGAGTLFEAAFFGKKIICIPLETAQTSHQYDNAVALSQEYPELCTVLRQTDVEQHPERLCSLVTLLFTTIEK